jgi:hypothetical protein
MCIFAYQRLPYGTKNQMLLIDDKSRQAHPWMVPLRTLRLDFPRVVEL